MASAEILRVRPVSGAFPEIPFDAHGNTTWVKFTDDRLGEWCGVFGAGVGSTCLVTSSAEGRVAFVVSAGQGYFVDIDSRRMLHKTRSNQIVKAAFIPGSNDVVVSDWTNILVLGADGSVWDSGRVSFDGITFTEITEEWVKGVVNDLSEDGEEFLLRLNPISYNCNWRFPQ